MMRVICCYCRKEIRTKPSELDGVSHGVCDACLPLMVRELGQPMQEYLDELQAPVLVVQDNARVISANAAARKLMSKEEIEICGELAGDVIGAYSFDSPLKPGDRLVFTDMAHYTMVKNNTFNGINLPAIVLRTRDGLFRTVRSFGYEDFKTRLS